MAEVTYGPRSRDNARLLLDAAAALGYPSTVVKTGRGGYLVPQDVLDTALGVEKIEEGVFYPAPPETPSEGQEEAPVTVEKPRGNASREAWAEYAVSLGVHVGDDLSRDDIKNLVNEEE
jgi:hypothetical protein